MHCSVLAFQNLLGALHVPRAGSEAGEVGALGRVALAGQAGRAGRPGVSSWSGLPLRAGGPREPVFRIARFPGRPWPGGKRNRWSGSCRARALVSPLPPSTRRGPRMSSARTARGRARGHPGAGHLETQGGLALAVRTEAVIRAPSRGAKLGQGQVGSTRPTARWTEARPPGLGRGSGRRVRLGSGAPRPHHRPGPSSRVCRDPWPHSIAQHPAFPNSPHALTSTRRQT